MRTSKAAWPIQGLIKHFRPEIGAADSLGQGWRDTGGSGVRSFTLVICAALIVIAFPLNAAEKSDPKDIAANRKIMANFARCVVDTQLKKATEVIVANIDNSGIQKRYGLLIDGECLAKTADVATLTMGGDLFRYALADAFFQKNLARKTLLDFAQVPKLAHLSFGDRAAFENALTKITNKRKRDKMQYDFDEYNGTVYLSRYGECVVRLNPAAARNLLLTPVASPDEAKAIGPLRPALAECLMPGRTVSFNAAMVRGISAINYVRLAMSMPAIVSEGAR